MSLYEHGALTHVQAGHIHKSKNIPVKRTNRQPLQKMEGSTEEYEVDLYVLRWTELQALRQGFVSHLIRPCVYMSTCLNTEVHSPFTMLVRGVLFQGCAWAWSDVA